jgi:hypothetical protein
MNNNEQNAEAVILKELDFIASLRAFAVRPESDWSFYVEQALKNHRQEKPTGEQVANTLEMNRGALLMEWYRHAKAVNPTGPDDDLAPAVAAVRMKNHCSEQGAEFIAEKCAEAVWKNDVRFFARLTKFMKAPLCDHPNFLVWDAIVEYINKYRSGLAQDSDLEIFNIPRTAQLRAFINEKDVAPRYQSLVSKCPKGWERIWKESGADMIIAKSKSADSPKYPYSNSVSKL